MEFITKVKHRFSYLRHKRRKNCYEDEIPKVQETKEVKPNNNNDKIDLQIEEANETAELDDDDAETNSLLGRAHTEYFPSPYDSHGLRLEKGKQSDNSKTIIFIFIFKVKWLKFW